MSDFWKQIKKLFQTAESSSPSNPLIHEVIQRSEQEKEDYQYWKNTLVCKRLISWLHEQYAIYQVLPDDIDEAIDFLNTPSAKGFVIHFHKTQYSQRDVTHLLDYLKEKVLDLNYRPQISDTRTYNRSKWVEQVQRHYLKPSPSVRTEGKLNQRFGNIKIELFFRDNAVYNLQFSATTYKDSLFNEADEFKKLMMELL